MSSPQFIEVKRWNKEYYKEFAKYLLSLQDIKYKDFHSSLVLNSKYEMMGIRVPIMRDIAKKISKSNIEEFLEYAQNKYYEEIMIQGLVISHIKDEKLFYKHFIEFIKKIDNWAICDSFCSSIKLVKNFEEKYFKEAIKMSLNGEEFTLDLGQVFRHIFLRIFIIFSFAFKVFFTYCVKNTTQNYKISFDLYNFRNGIKRFAIYTFLTLTILLLFMLYF